MKSKGNIPNHLINMLPQNVTQIVIFQSIEAIIVFEQKTLNAYPRVRVTL